MTRSFIPLSSSGGHSRSPRGGPAKRGGNSALGECWLREQIFRERSGSAVKGNERNFMASGPGDASDAAPTAERRRASILIVEDEALIASYIQEVLEESG